MLKLRRITALLLLPLLSGGAAAAQPASEADLAKLRKELQEQRQLLVAILKAEQKRNEMLLRYLLLNEPLSEDLGLKEEALPAGASEPAVRAESPRTEAPKARPPATATLRGTVSLSGAAGAEAWVYVEDVPAPPVAGSVQIKQERKQFSPRSAVVQRGTRLVFSNADTIYHNVFSNSSGYNFDLGATRAGDAPKTIVAATPGIVDIFCNMHSGMSSTVLVVPNALFAKVHRDGTFEIPDVPLGAHRVVAWAPWSKAQREAVEVKAGGAEVRLSLQVSAPGPHSNKFGQAYGSYEE